MTPEALAACHAAAFAGQSRAWTAAEFAALLQSAFVFTVGDARAFAMGRVIADEAEVLTVATAPAHRRQGLAQQCLAEFEGAARARGAGMVFLEVAEDNPAALTLYRNAGFAEAARRTGYYPRSDGSRIDALILRKTLD
ncbi:GNAT family N-acetyltransferase [Roseovarius sp.]|uniref:GNAT family N-acetyltransferase n=1 Tax=Roseovarius sp. TaxID=1486281 RepID=UPI003A97D3BE